MIKTSNFSIYLYYTKILVYDIIYTAIRSNASNYRSYPFLIQGKNTTLREVQLL